MMPIQERQLRALPPGPPSGRWARVRLSAGRFVTGVVHAARSRATPVADHFRDNAYSVMGLGLISGASFVHSVFTGLLVTGLMILIFEWKVSD